MAEEWDKSSPFYKALVSTTHSLSQVSLHSAWEGSRYDNSLHLHNITIIFSSPSHFLIYVALIYCHTSSGNMSESGAHCTRFLIFDYFLSPLSEIVSVNVHEPRHDWIVWNELEMRREIEKRQMHTFNHSRFLKERFSHLIGKWYRWVAQHMRRGGGPAVWMPTWEVGPQIFWPSAISDFLWYPRFLKWLDRNLRVSRGKGGFWIVWSADCSHECTSEKGRRVMFTSRQWNKQTLPSERLANLLLTFILQSKRWIQFRTWTPILC